MQQEGVTKIPLSVACKQDIYLGRRFPQSTLGEITSTFVLLEEKNSRNRLSVSFDSTEKGRDGSRVTPAVERR